MISEKNIFFGISGKDKKEVMEQLVKEAYQLGYLKSAEETLQSVLEREKIYSTGFGKGIAIPHGITDSVITPALMVGKLDVPVEWESEDGKPVSMVFLILVPEDGQKKHFQLLANLARKLMHDEFTEAIYKAETAEQFAELLRVEVQ